MNATLLSYVIEEWGDGEGVGSEALSLLAYATVKGGQRILGAKAGRGKYDMWWYDWVVKALLSSYMSVGCSLTERDVPCLVIRKFFVLRCYARRGPSWNNSIIITI